MVTHLEEGRKKEQYEAVTKLGKEVKSTYSIIKCVDKTDIPKLN